MSTDKSSPCPSRTVSYWVGSRRRVWTSGSEAVTTQRATVWRPRLTFGPVWCFLLMISSWNAAEVSSWWKKKYFWHLSAVTSSEQLTVGRHQTGCRHEGRQRWLWSAQQATPLLWKVVEILQHKLWWQLLRRDSGKRRKQLQSVERFDSCFYWTFRTRGALLNTTGLRRTEMKGKWSYLVTYEMEESLCRYEFVFICGLNCSTVGCEHARFKGASQRFHG